MDPPEILWKATTNHIAVFVPPNMIEHLLEKHYTSTHASGSSFWIKPPASSNIAQDLLSNIHQSVESCRICGIILTSIAANGPAELVILEVPKGVAISADILVATNGEGLVGSPDCIIKILPVTNIRFTDDDRDGEATSPSRGKESSNQVANFNTSRPAMTPLLPTCPVCIHRIDPVRLGLPAPANQHLCSRFCPSPIGTWAGGSHSLFSSDETCPKAKIS